MEHAFSPTLLESCRLSITAVFDAYQAATSYRPTFVAHVVMGDRAFASRYLSNGLNVSTYDQFMGRMSGIWPAGAEWPAHVPRQAPVQLDEAGAAMLREREGRRAPTQEGPGQDASSWPEDIPRPQPRS